MMLSFIRGTQQVCRRHPVVAPSPVSKGPATPTIRRREVRARARRKCLGRAVSRLS